MKVSEVLNKSSLNKSSTNKSFTNKSFTNKRHVSFINTLTQCPASQNVCRPLISTGLLDREIIHRTQTDKLMLESASRNSQSFYSSRCINNDSGHDFDPGHAENQHHFTPGNAENAENSEGAENYRSNGKNQNEDEYDTAREDSDYTNTVGEIHRESDVYANCIRTPGDESSPNDIVPEMMARMPVQKGLLKGRSLVVEQEGVAKLYAHDSPAGGQVLAPSVSGFPENTVVVRLDPQEKGDSMYQKILAAANNTNPSDISIDDINKLRQKIARFVRDNPELAEDANDALENDPFYKLTIDEAVDTYQTTPHTEHPIYTHRSTKPWLEPLMHLLLTGVGPVASYLFRGEPLFGQLPQSKVTSVDINDHSVIQDFKYFINDHQNMDRFIIDLDSSLQEVSNQPTISGQVKELIAIGEKLSDNLKTALTTGMILNDIASLEILEFVLQLTDINIDNSEPVQPETRTYGEIYRHSITSKSNSKDVKPAVPPDKMQTKRPNAVSTVTGFLNNTLVAGFDILNGLDSYLRFPMAEALSFSESEQTTTQLTTQLTSEAGVSVTTPDSQDHGNAIDSIQTLLHNPAKHIPPFEQNNPNITVTEQAYEYSRIVLGLLQLRFEQLSEYELPVHFVPVLLDGNTGEIEYRAIFLANASVQDVNDLSKEDPNTAEQQGQANTMAYQLGEIHYQSSLRDRQLVFDPPEGSMTSTNSINDVIANLYRFVPGQGYQLTDTTITYQELITGDNTPAQQPSSSGLNPQETAQDPLEIYNEHSGLIRQVNDFVRDEASNLLESPEILSEDPVPDLFKQLKLYLFDHWGSRQGVDVEAFVDTYENVCRENVRSWYILPESQLNEYLNNLQSATTPGIRLSLSTEIWVKSTTEPCKFQLLVPYRLAHVLSGGLSGFDSEQLIVPSSLTNFASLLVHQAFLEIMDEACSYIERYPDRRQFTDFYARFTIFSSVERNQKIDNIRLLNGSQLASYLDLIATEYYRYTGYDNRPLALSDKVYVRSAKRGFRYLVEYTLDEVLSGVLMGYQPNQILLTPQLLIEGQRDLITHPDFSEIIEDVYLSTQQRRSNFHSTSQSKLSSYLNILKRDIVNDLFDSVKAGKKAGKEELRLSDKIEVYIFHRGFRFSVNYTLGEVLSGVLTGYDPQQLILPPKLEAFRSMITRSDITTIMEEAYFKDCAVVAQTYDSAPREILEGCMHVGILRNNPLMLSTVKQIVEGTTEYQPSLMISFSDVEMADQYTTDELISLSTGYLEAMSQQKLSLLASSREAGQLKNLPRDELTNYHKLFQQGAIDQLTLVTRFWLKSEFDGIHLLVPYAMDEVFRGAISGFDPGQFLVPPEVEPFIHFLTRENATDIIHDACEQIQLEGMPTSITRLYDPARHIPGFDQNNPHITVTEQAYEYSRLVLGLIQLRFEDMPDYKLPVYFAPVLLDSDTGEIGYRSIFLANVSLQDVNDLAKHDPYNPNTDQTDQANSLAYQLAGTVYESAFWDRVQYREFGTFQAMSTLSIHEVISNFYQFVSGQGYQVAETSITYRELLTGNNTRPEARKRVMKQLMEHQNITVEPVDSVTHQSYISSLVSPQENEQSVTDPGFLISPDVLQEQTATSPYPLTTSLENGSHFTTDPIFLDSSMASQTTEQDVYINDYSLLVDRFLSSELNNIIEANKTAETTLPDLYRELGDYLVREGVSQESSTAFVSKYRAMCSQYHLRMVPVLPQEKLNNYLEIIQPTDATTQRLTLSDNLWVNSTDLSEWQGSRMLTPYPLVTVLSGRLSGLNPDQLIVPHQLASFSDILVHEQFLSVMDQAYQYVERTQGTLENYLSKFETYRNLERLQKLSGTEILNDNQLLGYLHILQPENMEKPNAELRVETGLSDNVYVKIGNDEVNLLVDYTLREVLSGALTGYDATQLILPSQLQAFGYLLTYGDFNDIIHKAYLQHCSVDSIKTNSAPEKQLEQCMHFSNRLLDNLFIRSAINEIVEDLIEYSAELLLEVESRLFNKQGTDLYSEDQLRDYLTNWRLISNYQTQQLMGNAFFQGRIIDKPEHTLEKYLTRLLVEPDDPISLDTPIWYKHQDAEVYGLIRFTLREVLKGCASGLDQQQMIFPPELEKERLFLVDVDVANKLYQLLGVDEIKELVELVKESLSATIFPDSWIHEYFENIKRNTEHHWGYIELSTVLGRYVVAKPYNRAKQEFQIRTEECTAWDLLINTFGGKSDREVFSNFLDEINPPTANVGLEWREISKALINADLEKDYYDQTDGALNDADFNSNLSDLMSKIVEFKHPLSISPNSLNIEAELILSNSLRHPFITVIMDPRDACQLSPDPQGCAIAFFPWSEPPGYEMTLFSYITGQTFVTTFDEFHSNFTAEGSDIHTWISMNGGEIMLKNLGRKSSYIKPFDDESRSEPLSRSDFIDKAFAQSVALGKKYIDSINRSHYESWRAFIFDVVQELLGFIGYIPVVGDFLELAAQFTISEIEIQIEDEILMRQELRREQRMTMGIGAGLGFLPGVTIAATKKIFKKVLKKTNSEFLGKLGNLASSGTTAGSNLFDGLPNRQLDVDGNAQVFNSRSSAWKTNCASVRKKRGITDACGLGVIDAETQAEHIKPIITLPDANKIKSYLEGTFKNLGYPGRTSSTNMDSFIKAIDYKGRQAFRDLLAHYGLHRYAIRLFDSIDTYFDTVKFRLTMTYPDTLKVVTKKYKKLQAKATRLTNKYHINPTPKKLNDAQEASRKLLDFKDMEYLPELNRFEAEIYKKIESSLAFDELAFETQSLREVLPDNIRIQVPIMHNMKEWGYNTLLSKIHASVSPKFSIEDKIYLKKNLNFATAQQAQSTTLHFSSKKYGSGNLSLQNPVGEQIQDVNTHKRHAFFRNKEDFDQFFTQVRELHNNDQLNPTDFDTLLKQYNGRKKPKSGYYHAEVDFKSNSYNAPSARVSESPGTVLGKNDLRRYANEVTNIYQSMKQNALKALVYQKQNLRFVTKELGRDPSYYFSDPVYGSGHLRQSHDQGAQIFDIDPYTERAFFDDPESFDLFQVLMNERLRDGTMTYENFIRGRHSCRGRNFPRNGDFHAEAGFKANDPDAKITMLHFSGGTVIMGSNLEEYHPYSDRIYAFMQRSLHTVPS